MTVNMLLQSGIRAVYGADEVLRIAGSTPGILAEGGAAREVLVGCKKDHRVAMTAAVLAVGLHAQGASHLEVAVDDMRCVDKTYPTFWKDMKAKFGLDVATRREFSAVRGAGAGAELQFPALPPICLIGLPGCGKSSLAGPLAKQFGLELVDICLLYTSDAADE